jgi:hypothetical protein
MFPLAGTGRSNSTGPPRYRPGGLCGTAALAGSGSGSSAGAGGTGARARTAGSRSGSSSASAWTRAVLNRSAGTPIAIA